jgi:hypothetical protein
MNKTTFAWMWVVIVFALVVAGGAVAWALGIFAPSYYAVYMTTGDLYFGSIKPLSHTLYDTWYLQRDINDQSLNVNDFSKAAWKPTGDIELNKDLIVWKARLDVSSPIIQALEGNILQKNEVPQQSYIQPQPIIQEIPDLPQTTTTPRL